MLHVTIQKDVSLNGPLEKVFINHLLPVLVRLVSGNLLNKKITENITVSVVKQTLYSQYK